MLQKNGLEGQSVPRRGWSGKVSNARSDNSSVRSPRTSNRQDISFLGRNWIGEVFSTNPNFAITLIQRIHAGVTNGYSIDL